MHLSFFLSFFIAGQFLSFRQRNSSLRAVGLKVFHWTRINTRVEARSPFCSQRVSLLAGLDSICDWRSGERKKGADRIGAMNRRRLKTFRSIQGRILNRKTGFDKLRGEEYIAIIYFKNFTFTVFYLFISKKSCLIECKNIWWENRRDYKNIGFDSIYRMKSVVINISG